jgi:hypothetical protein
MHLRIRSTSEIGSSKTSSGTHMLGISLPVEEKGRFRLDMIVEWTIIDEAKGLFRGRMIPDPARYEERTVNGEDGYYDRYDNIFFPKRVLAEAAPSLAGKPIYAPQSIDDLDQYFRDAVQRIAIRKT